jgi:uncharacterized protein YbjT (DUF2867 family)
MHGLISALRRAAALALLAGLAVACAGLQKPPQTVLVAGATGQTGQLVVRQLQREGYRVHALVRNVTAAQELLGPQVVFVEGNVTDPAAVAAAMSGVDAVISALGARGKDGPDRPETVDYGGVKNLVEAAKQAKLRQFVLVSSRGVTQLDHPLNRMFGDVLKWKLQGENHLRASGLAYTIVRPGGLLNEPGGTGDIVFEQGDRQMGSDERLFIAREDVAMICVQALRYPEARFRTFETHRVEGTPVTDWRTKFAALKPDA